MQTAIATPAATQGVAVASEPCLTGTLSGSAITLLPLDSRRRGVLGRGAWTPKRGSSAGAAGWLDMVGRGFVGDSG